MADKTNKYYTPPVNRSRQTQPPIKDLRELLDRKRQEREVEEQNSNRHTVHGPPPDPPSILRDSLRGDEPQYRKNDYKPSYSNRSRGSFRTRNSRGSPQNTRGYSRGKLQPCNIKVEFSTETGNRKCTIDSETKLHGNHSNLNINKYERGRFSPRRNYRSSRRPRGNFRGQYFYSSYNRKQNYTDRDDNDQSAANNASSTSVNHEEEEENWDNDISQENNKAEHINEEQKQVSILNKVSVSEEKHEDENKEYDNEEEYYDDDTYEETIDENQDTTSEYVQENLSNEIEKLNINNQASDKPKEILENKTEEPLQQNISAIDIEKKCDNEVNNLENCDNSRLDSKNNQIDSNN